MKTRFLVGAALGSILVAASCTLSTQEGGPAPTAPDEPTAAAASADDGAEAPDPSKWQRRHLANGLLPGMKPYRGPGKQIAVTPTCTSPALTYYGGPILQSPVIVAVFWNGNVNPILTAPTTGLGQFFADVTTTPYWSWLQEYNTVGTIGGTAGTDQVILPGSFGGQFTITPSVCPTTTSTKACKLTDAQLQTELNNQIAAGVLPVPTLDCTGNTNTIYMVSFPPHITLSGPDGSGTSCSQFCAYHNTGTITATNAGSAIGKPLVYGALMDEFTGTCATGCGANTGTNAGIENSTDTASHELAEAVTDTDIGLDTQNGYANPAAWGDNNNSCGEIGDICDSNSAGDTITVSGRSWIVQELWSNKQGKCTSTGTALPVCSGTTLTNCRKCSCGDTGNACTGATGVCETTSTNVLFGACEQCTSKNSTACGTSTCTQSTTTTTDDTCVSSCVPLTACPAGDNCGTISNNCGGTVTCGTGTCPTGETCTNNVCASTCVPLTACPAGDNCGTISNGCGGTVTCGTGTCPTGETCSNNVCGSTCVPVTTCPTGDNCGTISNGCGGTLSCGTCATGQTCNGNVCGNTCLTACPTGSNCGTLSNGCGGTLLCGGACATGETCTNNVCGSTCLTACPTGANCGTLSNNCGGTLVCGGACTGTETCGGGGVANVCGGGCVPATTCPAGDNCGTASDGCGGMISCGTCATGDTCTNNVCGTTCTPLRSCPTGNCGTMSDGCGGMVTCTGTCAAPETCGGGNPGVANVCGCTPISSCAPGYCGPVPDGCNGMFNCGGCAAGQTCDDTTNLCVTAGATTSSSSTSTSTGSTSSSTSGSTTLSGGGAGGGTATTTSSTTGAGGAGGAGTTTSTGIGGATFGAGGSGGSAVTTTSGGDITTGTGTSGTPGSTGGCSCEAAGETPGSSGVSLGAFGALALVMARRNRRRRSN